MANLKRISDETAIRSEFVGIYNENNDTISSEMEALDMRVTTAETNSLAVVSRMKSLSEQYARMNNTYKDLMEKYTKLQEDYDTLSGKYGEVVQALNDIKETLDEITKE